MSLETEAKYVLSACSPRKERIRTQIVKDLGRTPPETFTGILDAFVASADTENPDGYMTEFRSPLFGTKRSIRELYTINPVVMEPVLRLLMKSKKAQHLQDSPGTGTFNIKTVLHRVVDMFPGCDETKRTEYHNEINTYGPTLYKEIEEQIAIAWVEAVRQEPRFQSVGGRRRQRHPTRRCRSRRPYQVTRRNKNGSMRGPKRWTA
jgi:hypothetical protein